MGRGAAIGRFDGVCFFAGGGAAGACWRPRSVAADRFGEGAGAGSRICKEIWRDAGASVADRCC